MLAPREQGRSVGGGYFVDFSNGCGNPGNYAQQFYDHEPSLATANPVVVTAGETTGSIDAVMQPGGSISRTVTAAGGGPLQGICVSAYLPGGQEQAGEATTAGAPAIPPELTDTSRGGRPPAQRCPRI